MKDDKHENQRFLDRTPEQSEQLDSALIAIARLIDELSQDKGIPHATVCEAAMVAGGARYLDLFGPAQTGAWLARFAPRVNVPVLDPPEHLQ